MRKSCLFILVCVLAGSVLAEVIQIPADVSCRTDLPNRAINRHDSNKLSIRSDGSAAKSWIKWNDLDGIDPGTIRHAELRLTTYETRPGTFSVSAVNDNYLVNIDWTERYDATPPPPYGITWNNGPANSVESYTDVLAGSATLVGTMDFLGTIAGDQRFIDVTSILQADTDGIVQFILHNSSGLMNMCTHDQSGTMATGLVIGPENARPYLFVTLPPEGADWPDPEVGEVVLSTLPSLSWVNPEPNNVGDPIWCEVYLGTEPNRLDTVHMKKVTLGNDIETVAISAFGLVGGLQNNETYFWFVDCHDPVKGLVEGEEWRFIVGTPPVVDAGADQVLEPNDVTVLLDATVTDDGACTYLWEQVDDAAPDVSANILPNNTVDTSVAIRVRGVYTFKLTATDTGGLQGSDTVRIVVGDDACDASHLDSGADFDRWDANQDCLVDLADFETLIADHWLECSDTLTHCAQ